jgi:hypothetical protein
VQVDENAPFRFARLIYNQLKVKAMQADANRDLVLDFNEALNLLSNLVEQPADA